VNKKEAKKTLLIFGLSQGTDRARPAARIAWTSAPFDATSDA
jgi:hypothetical protein